MSITTESTVTDEALKRINAELNLGAESAEVLRSMYDDMDLRYMVSTGKQPPTANTLAIAFGKFISGMRSDPESWTSLDEDAYVYSSGQF